MKNYTSKVKKKLMDYYEGVPVTQIHGCMGTKMVDVDNFPTVKDLQHEVYKERRLKMEGGDAAAMMAYFDRMQADNQNFFNAHQLDEEGRLKDVLWVDSRSRVAYEEFGDVWLACMGKPPGAILTDQATAMRKPLEVVMSSSRHRWCIWHIMRKIPEKLGKCKDYAYFKSPLKTLIYESFTCEEFEARWHALIVKYHLQGNDWLCDLFEERHMWIPAFMKEYFWAGMKTTQRVESINRFFDGFVNRTTQLHEFLEKYTRAMWKRVKAELDADARCGEYLRRLVNGFKLEKFFQEIYTDAKFEEVQKECARMGYCNTNERRDIGNNKTEYELEDRVWIIPEGKSEDVITDRKRIIRVIFDHESKEVCCDCRKFETFGILCKHVIRVFDLNGVVDIPNKYVLDRWRKDIPRKHTRVKVAYHDPGDQPHVQQHRKLMREFEDICDEVCAVDDADTIEMVMGSLNQLRLNVKESRKTFLEKQVALPSLPPSEKGSNQVGTQAQTPSSGVQIKDPITRKKPRGRPKGSRYKSSQETRYKTKKQSANNQKTNLVVEGKRKRSTRQLSDVYEDCVDPDWIEEHSESDNSYDN
ncbi:protein FAR-RED IMPAIRED RESPONSE 1-like [Chenopodium quinoa]|uniref:protein FAR-RED IMPAIRED RESPONSE 1-like n=1 Tax=Chenopodium quinoa TaxID=63459 RepID=UPI000B786414|nr:protein FAR-RED IMPAIRED RESPONSE 1-like [Chenopodium quinoa]